MDYPHPHCDLHCFCARLATLPDLLEHLRQACAVAQIDASAMLRVELVLEELFTNTIRHGYRGDSDAPVWLGAVGTPGTLSVVYQDAAPPHDPLAHSIELPDALDERAVGGLGIRLARQLASSIAYARTGDRNILTLIFRGAAC